jgi:hypothetical protein
VSPLCFYAGQPEHGIDAALFHACVWFVDVISTGPDSTEKYQHELILVLTQPSVNANRRKNPSKGRLQQRLVLFSFFVDTAGRLH